MGVIRLQKLCRYDIYKLSTISIQKIFASVLAKPLGEGLAGGVRMADITMLAMEKVSDMIQKKEVSPVELVEGCLKKIEQWQPKVNAFVYVQAEEARKAAVKAEQEICTGKYKGRMHGIPIAFKDLFYTKGIPTTAGSKVLKDFVPEKNGTVVQRFLDAGAILLGKTNTQEFAIGPTSEDSMFGPTRNPWNTDRIPGGSSGGSAVAAVTGMAYVAMGTDTGGSIRIPSSMCGTVGFKPTYGLTSLQGIVPMCLSMDHAGPITRSVADAAIAVDCITGTDKEDPCPLAIKGEATHFYEQIKDVQNLHGMKIGVPVNFFLEKTDEEVERLFWEAVERLKELGAEVKEVEIPLMELLDETGDCIVFCGATYLHRNWYPRLKDLYSEGVADRLAMGETYSALQYVEAKDNRDRMKKAWEDLMDVVDVVVMPTCPIEAFAIGLPKPWLISSKGRQEYGKAMCSRHTRLANLLECPALTVPAGLTHDHLPAGLMIMGKKYDDCGVLRVGMAYERNYTYPALS